MLLRTQSDNLHTPSRYSAVTYMARAPFASGDSDKMRLYCVTWQEIV